MRSSDTMFVGGRRKRNQRRGNRLLDADTAQSVVWWLRQGFSIRAVAAKSNASTITVGSYRRILLAHGELPESCECGKVAGHNGWCWFRYKLSPARQRYWMQRLRSRVAERRPSTKEMALN